MDDLLVIEFHCKDKTDFPSKVFIQTTQNTPCVTKIQINKYLQCMCGWCYEVVCYLNEQNSFSTLEDRWRVFENNLRDGFKRITSKVRPTQANNPSP